MPGIRYLVLFCLWPAYAQASGLLLTTEDSPPAQMMREGVLAGRSVDKVREIMRRTGTQYDMQLLPWARAYELALRQGAQACVFSTTRNVQREGQFKWVGPLTKSDWVLFGQSGRDYGIKSLADVRRYVVGTYNADVRDAWLKERGFRVDTAPQDEMNPRKLMAGRIDLWANDADVGRILLQNQGLEAEIKPVFTFHSLGLYLACNPAVPDGLISRLQIAYDEMARDGYNRRIDAEYDKY
ncbi:substrate-binding periplasmic protein [Chitinimonas sp. JJ19]|uniref:substrate-binding periplasmic protein n=1 Tax=Chitinimonas sp. JJ19 TaxID=3109352 RepID=UPI00300157AA